MERLFGLETEYGLQVDGDAEADMVAESLAVVRAWNPDDSDPSWDYASEDPRLDLRGFRVDRPHADAEIQQETRHLRPEQVEANQHGDRILCNGARLYNDHTHPEYSTPECARLFDLVASDRAGERIMLECARRRTQARSSGRLRLFKNNTDFKGHSYGCHENHLIGRQIGFDQVVAGLVPFLVTRQIYTGAGKVGLEGESGPPGACYQLTQRADFFRTLAGIDTMDRRALVNTRDEPHADPRRYRRLHIITGDANMSQFATALKVGTLALVLELLQAGAMPDIRLLDPVTAFRAVSRDPGREWPVPLEGGGHSCALDVQQCLLHAVSAYSAGRDAETDWILHHWQAVLEELGRDPQQLVGRVDWVTKEWLLQRFIAAEGLDWNDPQHLGWLQSQDLQYHSIDPAEGLYRGLEAQGVAWCLVAEDRCRRAVAAPPGDTRAYFRGRCLERFGAAVRRLTWDRIELELDAGLVSIDLSNCLATSTVAAYNRAVDQADSAENLISVLHNLEPPAAGDRTGLAPPQEHDT